MRMPIEHMVELHKYLYLSDDADQNKLKDLAIIHQKFIPSRKLYRYRKANDQEFSTLSENCIWLSNPMQFNDIFDATIPMENTDNLYFDYPFYFTIEIAYKALAEIKEEGETLPSKEELISLVYDAMDRYDTQEKIDAQLIEFLGPEGFKEYKERKSPYINLIPRIERSKKVFDNLSMSPREDLAIASFSRTYDNRNMWENYSQNYTGFCVEYKFPDVKEYFSVKLAWDILHFLPIKYYKKRPLFNYDSMLQSMVQFDMKISDFHINGDEFLSQYYLAITSKQYDYRAEQEWRYIIKKALHGKYEFPYINKIIIGKDMSADNEEKIRHIAKNLAKPLFKQTVDTSRHSFSYEKLVEL